MKALVTRVKQGKIIVGGNVVSSIGKGLAVFLGLERCDSDSAILTMAEKVINLRIFEDDKGKLNHSAKERLPYFMYI